MDPVIGGLIVGTALHMCRAKTKYKKAQSISRTAIERVAEAEMRFDQHKNDVMTVFDCLCTRITGVAEFLNGPFAEMFRPFESENGSYRTDLFGDAEIADLAYIQTVNNARKIYELPAYKKQSRAVTAVSFLLFGAVGEANRELDTAKRQSEVSWLIAEQNDTFCMMLDLQKERYQRIYQLLGALNVALLYTSKKAKDALCGISWMLDVSGHIPKDMSAEELQTAIPSGGMCHLTNSINIAKVIMTILKEPLFDENKEINEKAEKVLLEGERALKQIQEIKGR